MNSFVIFILVVSFLCIYYGYIQIKHKKNMQKIIDRDITPKVSKKQLKILQETVNTTSRSLSSYVPSNSNILPVVIMIILGFFIFHNISGSIITLSDSMINMSPVKTAAIENTPATTDSTNTQLYSLLGSNTWKYVVLALISVFFVSFWRV